MGVADLANRVRQIAAQQARRRRAADGSCFADLFLDVSLPSRRRGVHSQEWRAVVSGRRGKKRVHVGYRGQSPNHVRGLAKIGDQHSDPHHFWEFAFYKPWG